MIGAFSSENLIAVIGFELNGMQDTLKRYVEMLCGTFIIHQLKPWYENISKRQVKTPKIYFRDSGLYHTLMNIDSWEQLYIHPKLGASFEGFALEEVLRCFMMTDYIDLHDAYFWSTQSGAELDLFLPFGAQRLGFEFKSTSTPKITKSMKSALEDLKLDRLYVITPLIQGTSNYQIKYGVMV